MICETKAKEIRILNLQKWSLKKMWLAKMRKLHTITWINKHTFKDRIWNEDIRKGHGVAFAHIVDNREK